MKLWGGRFDDQLDPEAWQLNASISFDQRLGAQDVRGSLAWAQALKKAGTLATEECELICAGLERISEELASDTFQFKASDEDIHTAIERRLGEIIGPVAGKLHTGRSRNDQVATDFRLWLLDHLPQLDTAVSTLQKALLARAESDMDLIMPGYTHLQRAQPVLLSHWWLSFFWPLQRDRERLLALAQRTAYLPLGAGALAGSPFPINRNLLAQELGFIAPIPNSIDAVSDRDFAVEFLFCAALIGTHLSKLAEAVILFTSAEFSFFELADAYATGSSLMPQKKNPDIFELARGKTGALLGYLTGLLATLKGLPSSYDKDLQEDKMPVFNAFDTLIALLPVLAKAVHTLTIHDEKMVAALDAGMMATDLADYLVARKIPFRQAHQLAGECVQFALKSGKTLDALTQEEFQTIHPAFGPDIHTVFDPQQSVARRKVFGGTAPESVLAQLALAQKTHQEFDFNYSN